MLFRKITLSDKEKTKRRCSLSRFRGRSPRLHSRRHRFGLLSGRQIDNRRTPGHRPCRTKGNTSLSTNGITVKEDYQLQKLHSKIETALWLKETPELLIIASRSSRTKAMLTAVSKNKIKNCPVISFTRMKDKNFISDILGVPVISAYFEGWLSDKTK